MGNDPMQAAEDMGRWAEELERKAQQYQDLHTRMTGVSITETSPDKRVSVTVDANGITTDITLGAASKGMNPSALAAELMACTRRAQARLRTQVADLVHDTVGTDPAGEAIIGQYANRLPPLDLPTTPEPQTYQPEPATYTPPPPEPGARKPDRDLMVTPDEPDEDDLYFQRKSWLE
ncbi:YbaB/EbfC family nucleoid-associated protein [Nocardia sp. NPDC048505]|uniref:YbaB/EbfC family nucleoid-associated protein n=1 Tax=unclassified Nocardia TaxID=2637762 RepID=UPI0033D9291F